MNVKYRISSSFSFYCSGAGTGSSVIKSRYNDGFDLESMVEPDFPMLIYLIKIKKIAFFIYPSLF